MECLRCNTQNSENARYCAVCGMELPQRLAYSRQARPEPLPGKGLGIVSMVVGICSTLSFVYFGAPMAIAGIALGIVANKQAKCVGKTNGFAKAGIICSIFTLAVTTIYWLIFLLAYVGAFAYSFA